MKRFFSAALAAAFLFSPALPPATAIPAFAAQHAEAAWTRPAALRPGDCIGIVAPASPSETEEIQKAAAFLRKQGYRLKISPFCDRQYGFFAGTDSERASELNAFFRDDDVKAILCVRGGYGAARILNRLDYEAIAHHPKLFIGFSDITALHIALGQRCHLVTVHGPMLTSFANAKRQQSFTGQEFLRGLTDTKPLGEIPLPPGQRLTTIEPGVAEGPIVGGNLSLIASLVGTPYELRGDGALLFLEDVNSDSYQIDRDLQQLWQSGLLQRVRGLLIGDMDGDDDLDPGDFTTAEVIAYYARLAGLPAIKGIPAGHELDNMFLPFGVRARLEAREDGTASLRFPDAALDEAAPR